MPDLAPYDPAKIMDAVRDRIKAEFVSLIPEDAWKGLVDAEVKKFFEAPREDHYSRGYPSDFQRTVWGCLEVEVKKRVQEYLASPEWSQTWTDAGKPMASEAIKKILTDNASAVLTNVLGAAMQVALEQMKVRI
jgi:hypothetical protein